MKKLLIIISCVILLGIITSTLIVANETNNFIIGETGYTNETNGFPINENGQTYGSNSGLPYSQYPDLVLAVATNGIEGYIYKEELNDVETRTYEEILEYIEFVETFGVPENSVNVYAVNGQDIVGEFTFAPVK